MEKFAQRFCLLQDFLPNRHNWSLVLESKSIITVDPFYSLSSFVHLLVVEEKWRMICATGCAGNLIEFYSASTRLFQLSCKQDKSSNFSTFCFNVKPPVPCCTLLPQLPLCTVCLPRRWKWWELHQTRLVSGILTASQQRRRRSSVSKRMDLTLQRLSTPADSHLCQTSRGDAGIWCCTKWRRQSFGSDLQVNPQYFVGMWVSSGAPLVATGSQAGSQLATDAVNNATQCSVPPLYTFHTTPHTANPLGVHTSALCSVWVSRCITQCRTRTVRGVGGGGGLPNCQTPLSSCCLPPTLPIILPMPVTHLTSYRLAFTSIIYCSNERLHFWYIWNASIGQIVNPDARYILNDFLSSDCQRCAILGLHDEFLAWSRSPISQRESIFHQQCRAGNHLPLAFKIDSMKEFVRKGQPLI